MQRDVVSVSPQTPLAELSRLFVEEGVTGAPVVDEAEGLVGVVSGVDLLRAVEEEHALPRNDPRYFRDVLEFSTADWLLGADDFQDRLAQLTAADVMQTALVTVGEETPVFEVARTMREQRIHRVLVVRDGELVGIVSSFDLLSLLEKEPVAV